VGGDRVYAGVRHRDAVHGWVARSVSYKALYLSCLAVFTLASGLCALAWNLESLIAARILQALGGGAIQPIGMMMYRRIFEPHERARRWGSGGWELSWRRRWANAGRLSHG